MSKFPAHGDKPVDPDFGVPEHPSKPGKPDHELPGKPELPEKPEKPELPEKPEKPAKPDNELPEARAPRRTEKELLLSSIQAVLVSFNGLESNIPVRHEYWTMLNKYRSL